MARRARNDSLRTPRGFVAWGLELECRDGEMEGRTQRLRRNDVGGTGLDCGQRDCSVNYAVRTRRHRK